MNTAELTAELQGEVTRARHQLEAIGQRFSEDPGHALCESADDAFTYTARLTVAAEALSALISGCMVADVLTEAQEHVRRAVVDPPRWTSPTRNLLDYETARAWGRLLNKLEGNL